jgi:uncharacterized protein
LNVALRLMSSLHFKRRILTRIALLVSIAAVLVIALGFWNATRDPIIRTASVTVTDWPKDTPPFRVLLISDVHVAGPDMPPARLTQIIGKLNALKPDMVAVAGDLISEKRIATSWYTPDQIAALLAQFKSPHGTVLTLGNHDNWANAAAFRRALNARGMTVLENEAATRGPVIIGGVGDHFSGHDDVPATFAAMDTLESKGITRAPRIILSHSPDIIPALPRSVTAVMAGHTHCGQIALPFYGPVSYVSDHGSRFGCGDITDVVGNRSQRIFVGAGLGTSIVWLRYGAPPDVWLVTFGPQKRIS